MHAGVAHAGMLEVGTRQRGQLGLDLERVHLAPEVREQRRHIPRAGADLEHLVALGHAQLLQQPGLDLGLEHALAEFAAPAQRHQHVDEGQRAQGRRHEVLAAHDGQQVQHVLVDDLPGPDLLLDHVEAGLLDVHRGTCVRWGGLRRGSGRRL